MSPNNHHHTPSNSEPLVSDDKDVAAASKGESSVAIPVDDIHAKSTTSTKDASSKKKKRDWVARRKNAMRARQHFERGDVEAMKAAHAEHAKEKHSSAGSDYVKSVVFGGLDGIVTTFSVVTAAAGAGESWRTVLVFGFANALADAWSMGSGECISGMAEYDQAAVERRREMWEVENNIQGEIDEMIEIYEEQGFPSEDARELVRIISKDPERFVDVMMVEELGILIDLDDKWEPVKQGVVMFFSFIFFGMFPLLAYVGGTGQGLDHIFGIALGVTGVGLMLLGAAKGHLTGQSRPLTAVKMLANGCVSGGISFGIGVLVSYLVTGDAFAAV